MWGFRQLQRIILIKYGFINLILRHQCKSWFRVNHLSTFHFLIDVGKYFRSFFHNVHVMVIVFIFLFVFVAENYVFLAFVDIWLENFVWALRQSRPSVTFTFEVVITNIGISIRNANIISFILQHPRNLIKHFSGVLLRICPALN